jgi:hypothetical protein
MKKHEESIGVRLPDGRRFMATALVGPLESDEEILERMTKEVGTIYNVTGQKLLVVCLNPFKLKNITEREEDFEEPREREVKKVPSVAKVEPVVSKNEPEEAEPESERRSSSTIPAVGERWRPKDPRRIASFVVKDVQGEAVLTDDGRSIDLKRFSRYVRVEAAPLKAEA